jgi:hypothetical protein
MKIAVSASIVVLALSACGWASTDVTFGWRSYSGDLCEDSKAEPTGAKTIGIGYRSGLLPVLDLAMGLDYSWGDIDTGRRGSEDASFKHVAVRAAGAVPVYSPSITEIYVGGGLSYNYLDAVSIACLDDDSRFGFFGLAGVKVKLPGIPLSAYVEGQVERLTGKPGITVSSFLLGAGIGF